MYYKDIIRSCINKLLKIDKDFLIRINILKKLKRISFKNNEYTFLINNRNVYLRNLSSDFNVYNQVFEEHEYEFACKLFEYQFNDSPKFIIDVGANIGLTSIYFSIFYPEVRILSFEPEKENFLNMKKNIEGYKNITPVNKAVWKVDSLLKINNDFRDGRSWSYKVNESGGFQQVEATTLKHVIKEYGFPKIDILKIDIEGAEKEVILEDSSINEVLSLTKLICLEIHDSETSRIEITNKILNSGFKIYGKGETLFAVNVK